MYERVAKLEGLAPQEVEALIELLDSRAWEVLVDVQDRFVRNPAYSILKFSTDINEVLRAQGVLKGFRDLDGIMKRIYKAAKSEQAVEKEKELNE